MCYSRGPRTLGRLCAMAVLLVFVASFLCGCGKGRASMGGALPNVAAGSGTGTLKVAISWPHGSEGSFRLNGRITGRIPDNTQSIALSVTGDGLSSPVLRSYPKPPSGETQDEISLPPGNKSATAKALDAAGIVLADSSSSFTIQAGQSTAVDLNLNQQRTFQVAGFGPGQRAVLVESQEPANLTEGAPDGSVTNDTAVAREMAMREGGELLFPSAQPLGNLQEGTVVGSGLYPSLSRPLRGMARDLPLIHQELNMSARMAAVADPRFLARTSQRAVHAWGATESLWVFSLQTNSFSQRSFLRRTPGYDGFPGVTTNTLVYVEDVNGNGLRDDLVMDAQIPSVITAFETDNPWHAGAADGIYQFTRGIFGNEWDAAGGTDGEPKVVLALASSASLGSFPAVGGAILFGYFNPADEDFVRDAFLPAGRDPSNDGEILYLNADGFNGNGSLDPDGSQFMGLSTMAHELVHLILHNQKVARNGAYPMGAVDELAVIAEGLAELSEHENGFTIATPILGGGGNEFLYNIVQGYEVNPSGTGQSSPNFFAFTDNSRDKGKGYLMEMYIRDKFGAGAITNQCTTTATGAAAIQVGTGQPFSTIFSGFALTNYLDGITGAPAQYQYSSLNMVNIVPGYTLRGVGGTVVGTQLFGASFGTPGVPSSSQETLPAWTARYTGYTAGSAGTLTVTVTTNSGNIVPSLVHESPVGTLGPGGVQQ